MQITVTNNGPIDGFTVSKSGDILTMKKELKEYDDDLQDDLKWWEIPFILLFLGALLVFVNVVNWFSNPICRGLTLSALIGFILSVMLLLMTAYLWSV